MLNYAETQWIEELQSAQKEKVEVEGSPLYVSSN